VDDLELTAKHAALGIDLVDRKLVSVDLRDHRDREIPGLVLEDAELDRVGGNGVC
jgi:hypothetical protein